MVAIYFRLFSVARVVIRGNSSKMCQWKLVPLTHPGTLDRKTVNKSQKLLMYDGLDGTFRTIKLRGRQPKCPVCGDDPSIKHLIDYEQFCGAKASDKDKELHLLPTKDRISVQQYKEMVDSNCPHVLVDVRAPGELDICQLPVDSLNIQMKDLQKSDSIEQIREKISDLCTSSSANKDIPVVFVCRQGNDSQIAVNTLKETLKDDTVTLTDITGGLNAWSRKIDPDFPTY